MSNKDDRVVFRLVGTPSDGGLARLHDFTEFCKAVEKMLRETDLSITPEKVAPLQYRVADLQCTSAMICLEPVKPRGRDRRQEVIDTVRSTFKRLQEGKRPDSRLSPKALEAYRNVARPIVKSIGRTVESQQTVLVDGIELTSAFLVNLDKFSEKTVRSMGSVSGVLEQLNFHNKLEFAIFPKIGNHKVACQFDDSLYETVMRGVRQQVTVTGWMYYHEGKPFPVRAEAKSIIIHPTNEGLPLLSGMRGALSQPGVAVDLVRALRDE